MEAQGWKHCLETVARALHAMQPALEAEAATRAEALEAEAAMREDAVVHFESLLAQLRAEVMASSEELRAEVAGSGARLRAELLARLSGEPPPSLLPRHLSDTRTSVQPSLGWCASLDQVKASVQKNERACEEQQERLQSVASAMQSCAGVVRGLGEDLAAERCRGRAREEGLEAGLHRCELAAAEHRGALEAALAVGTGSELAGRVQELEREGRLAAARHEGLGASLLRCEEASEARQTELEAAVDGVVVSTNAALDLGLTLQGLWAAHRDRLSGNAQVHELETDLEADDASVAQAAETSCGQCGADVMAEMRCELQELQEEIDAHWRQSLASEETLAASLRSSERKAEADGEEAASAIRKVQEQIFASSRHCNSRVDDLAAGLRSSERCVELAAEAGAVGTESAAAAGAAAEAAAEASLGRALEGLTKDAAAERSRHRASEQALEARLSQLQRTVAEQHAELEEALLAVHEATEMSLQRGRCSPEALEGAAAAAVAATQGRLEEFEEGLVARIQDCERRCAPSDNLHHALGCLGTRVAAAEGQLREFERGLVDRVQMCERTGVEAREELAAAVSEATAAANSMVDHAMGRLGQEMTAMTGRVQELQEAAASRELALGLEGEIAELRSRLEEAGGGQRAELQAAEAALAGELRASEQAAAARHSELSAMVIDVGSAADAAIHDLGEAVGHERQRWLAAREELAAGLGALRQCQLEDREALDAMLDSSSEDAEARSALRGLGEEMAAEKQKRWNAEECICDRLQAHAWETAARHEALEASLSADRAAAEARAGEAAARHEALEAALGAGAAAEAAAERSARRCAEELAAASLGAEARELPQCPDNEPAAEPPSLDSTTAASASPAPASPSECAQGDGEAGGERAAEDWSRWPTLSRSPEEELLSMRAQDPRGLRAEAAAQLLGLRQLAAGPFAAWRRLVEDAWARRAVRSACARYRTRALAARALAGLAEHLRARRALGSAVEAVVEQWARDRLGEKLRTALEAWKHRIASTALGRRGADSMERWARASHLRSVLWAWRDVCPA